MRYLNSFMLINFIFILLSFSTLNLNGANIHLSPSSLLSTNHMHTREKILDERALLTFLEMYLILFSEIELNESLANDEKKEMRNSIERVCAIKELPGSLDFLIEWLLIIDDGTNSRNQEQIALDLKNHYNKIEKLYKNIFPIRGIENFEAGKFKIKDELLNKSLLEDYNVEAILTIMFDFSLPMYKRMEAALYSIWLLNEYPYMSEDLRIAPPEMMRAIQENFWTDNAEKNLQYRESQKTQFEIYIKLIEKIHNLIKEKIIKGMVLPFRPRKIAVNYFA